MKKLVSFLVILSLILTLSFPAAQAGTISQSISQKIEYITAGELVTSLLLGAKVKPNGIADYWGKAVQMGLIPGEVKKDKPLTRAQASYIVWKLINAVPELKAKNIPVSIRRVPPTEAFMRGICFFGGPLSSNYEYNNLKIAGYDLLDFIQGYQLLILEYKYADGSTVIKYVWDRYKGTSLAPGTYKYITDPFQKILDEFKKKYPDKLVYAPRPYQKGWLFTMDVVREAKSIKYPVDLVKKTQWGTLRHTVDDPVEVAECVADGEKEVTQLGVPITRQDIATINWYYYSKGVDTFRGGFGKYNIREHTYFNMYLEDYLVNYPRKYPTDHTRFAYYCKDYSKIPQLYREAMLRLADLGIITPDQSALYIGVYYFNPAKALTRAEAVEMINRVFDRTKRDVLDEVSVKSYQYWIPKVEVGAGEYMEYRDDIKKFETLGNADEFGDGIFPAQRQATFRIQEPKSLGFVKATFKSYPNDYFYWMMNCKQTSAGFVYSAALNNNHATVLMYDEADMTGIEEWDKNKAINYIPIAYRDEFKKDVNTYTAKYLVSKNMFLIKQYGNVYVYYNCWLGDKSGVNYQIYPTKPQMSGITFLVAKPNSKYTQ
ncbi:S-layer homology domain-containing protein [Caldicellulosiruptor acetigenus]|uniref:S-layer homology domain-containing protein n=1 Tax=Caldicellulosiruptor acetigenus TaxID=301953 RepID=UPI0022A8E312|nr:S-layer homology domain-containing protein [Caldicellulosiruptor acetigenus]WAM36592.1 S-layer homology domain-containing protein [Caldicellulosiruptor acetigenus]